MYTNGQFSRFQPKHHDESKRRRFAKRMVEALRQNGETRPIKYDPRGFRLRVGGSPKPALELYLGNAYAQYCAVPPGDQGKIIMAYTRPFRTQDLPETYAKARQQLRPRIWLLPDNESGRAPGYSEKPAAEQTWHKVIGDHLAAMLVYDFPDHAIELDFEHLAKWGVTGEEAFADACENLRRQSNRGFDSPAPGVFVSSWKDFYDSSRLVLTDLIRSVEVKGNYVAMVPSRDLLVITGSDDRAGLAVMLRLAQQAYAQNHNLSGIPLRLKDGAWISFAPDEHYNELSGFRTLRTHTVGALYNAQQ